MSENKKYYYLKLKENYFERDNVKILESMENGHTYSLIILKLYLKSLRTDGRLMMTDRIPYDPSKLSILAKVINHDKDHVKEAVKIAKELDIIEVLNTGEMFMAEIQNFIGLTSTEADRIREYRKKIETNQKLSGRRTIPQIEDANNKKRYGGNYYNVIERDNNKCAVCGDDLNIKVHHICGYNPNDKKCNEEKNLITLCSQCHGKSHETISNETKEKIKEYLYKCYNKCTEHPYKSTPEIELDIETDIKIKKEIKKKTKKELPVKESGLFNDIRNFFERNGENYYHGAKHSVAINKLITRCETGDNIFPLLNKFLKIKQDAEEGFWLSVPITPAAALASWDSIISYKEKKPFKPYRLPEDEDK